MSILLLGKVEFIFIVSSQHSIFCCCRSYITEPDIGWFARRDSSSRIWSTIEEPIVFAETKGFEERIAETKGFEKGIDASLKGTVGFFGKGIDASLKGTVVFFGF